MKLLTFVIPSYNSQDFLPKVLDSMLLPECLDKLEILVVNDGSTDGTAQVAQSYADRYPQTVRLISQENKGHGGALNTGLAAATGTYCKVVDADDWVIGLPQFLELLEHCTSDVVLTHHHTIDITTGEQVLWRTYTPQPDRAYTLDEIMAHWPDFERSMTFHGITYRREFYQAKAQPLVEHAFYEDHEYATFPCCQAASVYASSLTVYQYRIGDVSQSVSVENQVRRLSHSERVLAQMCAKYQQLPEGSGKTYAARKLQGLLLSYLTTTLLCCPDRAQGRRLARQQMELLHRNAPQVAAMAQGQYRIFRLLHSLHLNKSAWDAIVSSRLYRMLRRKRSFD